jgi:hypothetical protein
MLDLKPYYDAVVTAEANLKAKAEEINALFFLGTDEAKTQALALRPALDEAQNKYDQAAVLYESLKKANSISNVAAAFVPVSDTSPTPDAPRGVMKRIDFFALLPAAREEHLRKGGKVED